jgi:hypothetical protein
MCVHVKIGHGRIDISRSNYEDASKYSAKCSFAEYTFYYFCLFPSTSSIHPMQLIVLVEVQYVVILVA